jgi:hypothetical protein
MLIDQLGGLYQMVNGADRKVGRSAFEFLGVLQKRLAAIQSEIAKISPGGPPE